MAFTLDKMSAGIGSASTSNVLFFPTGTDWIIGRQYKMYAYTSGNSIGPGTAVGYHTVPANRTGGFTCNHPADLPEEGELIEYRIQDTVTTNNVLNGIEIWRYGTAGMNIDGTTTTSVSPTNPTITARGPGYTPPASSWSSISAYGDGFSYLRYHEDHDKDGNWATSTRASGSSGGSPTYGIWNGVIYFFHVGLASYGDSFRFKGASTSNHGVIGMAPYIDVDITEENTWIAASQSFQTTLVCTVKNTLDTHDYLLADNNYGNAGGGLAMGTGQLPEPVFSNIKQGGQNEPTNADTVFTMNSTGFTPGETKTLVVWMKRRGAAAQNVWFRTSANQQVTYGSSTPVMGTTTIDPAATIGAGHTVTINGSGTISSGVITDIDIIDQEGNSPTLSKVKTGVGTASASIEATFTTLDVDAGYAYKVRAYAGNNANSNVVTFTSIKTGGSIDPPGPGEGDYGLEIYNANQTIVLGSSSTVTRFVMQNSGTNTYADNSDTITVAGMTNTDDWVVTLGQVYAQGVTTVTKNSGSFTVTTTGLTSGESADYQYWVWRM